MPIAPCLRARVADVAEILANMRRDLLEIYHDDHETLPPRAL